MKGKFLNTKNVVIGLVSLVLIGASATGVTVFLKNRGEAAAAQEENQVQNLPTTGNDNQVNQGQNNSGNVIENPTNPETPVTPVDPTTPGTTTPGSTTTRPSTGTTTPSREEISQGIEETIRKEKQKVFEDLRLSWTTIGIPAITANMGIYKPELQIEKTATAVLKAGESEQIPVTENNKPMVRAGDTVIYTIRVLNLGNYKATNVVVTDSLDVIFDGKTVPANKELVKIETLEAGKVATLKVGYVVKQEDINAVLETEQNETISKDIINIATATDGKTTVEDEDDMPVNPDVTINVNKNWQDNDNQDGKRPEKITVELYRNNENEPVETVTIDASTDWKYVFSKLPKYDENKNEITYKVVEGTVPEYDTEYEITDNEVEIYNHHTPEKISISGSKTWDDADNQDGVRPESITVRLFADGKEVTSKGVTANDNWSWSFENLDKYKDGTEIVYTISEDAVTDYTTVVDGYNITNTHTPEKISITGSKTWDDASNQDGKRPSSITVRLLADGKEVASKTVTANDNWSWSFENLDKYKDGTEIVYTISEDTVADYTTVVDGYNITNTIKQEYVTLRGTKTWIEPTGTEHPTITLGIKQNGSNELYTVKGNPYTFTLENNETEYVFNSLPKYKTEIVDGKEKLVVENGKVVLNTYEVVEVTELTDYTVEYSGVSKVGYNFVQNITNRLNQTTINLTINKVWHDNITASERPEITIILNKNGDFYDSKKISNNETSCKFENLERYTFNNDGTCSENIYTITEETVDGYDVDTSSEIAKNGNEWTKTIINTKTQEKINIEGTKTWNCVPDGETKPTVIVELFRDYQDGDQAIARTEVVNGKYSFTDLDKFSPDDYHEYQYTVREIVPDGYIATYAGYNITNTKHITATKSAVTSTGVDEVNIGETINYTITITNNTEVATEVTVQDNIPGLNQGNVKVEVNGDITLEGKPLTEVEVQALYNGTFKVQMPATATRTIVIPIKVTAGMTGDKIKNTAYVNAEPTNEVINPIERTVAVTKYKNNLASTNIVLVLDVSSSMKGNKIKTAKQAIVDFINATYDMPENKDVTFTLITFADREYTEGARGDQQGKNYKYHGGLFEFNNEGEYQYGCGNFIITSGNYKKFETAFDGLLTDRGTNMRAGLEVAYATIYGESENTVSKLYPSYDKVVIFFGDGEPYGETNLKNNPEGIREAAGWLKNKKAKVYSIGFGNGASKGTKGYERLKDISSDGKVYTSSNYTDLVKNFSDIVSADPVVYPYTIDGNAVVELTAESTQKIVVDEKNPIIIKIGDAPEIKITDAVTAEKYKITFTDKKIIWDVKEYSKDTNLRISYHVQ